MNKRVQLWSCGGGRQSAGIAALIIQGRLPHPDHVFMSAARGEKRTTWDYVCGYIRPAMRSLGIPFTIVPTVKYATKGFFGGEDGTTPLMPVYTNQSGSLGKLSEWCSGEWKREVCLRWAAEQHDWKARGVDNWIGISYDERHRRRAAHRKWIVPVYPLLDMLPKMLPVSACLDAIEEIGWPPPPRSRCIYCPNQSDVEWAELTPDEWEKACRTEDMIRETDKHAFFHKQMIPLRMVKLEPKKDNGQHGGCSAGMCF